jgi:hypothetical protein
MFVLLGVAVATALWCDEARCAPLAVFNKAAERSCRGTEVCDLSFYSPATVGGYTGISLYRSGSGSAKITSNASKQSGSVHVESEGGGVFTAMFSWDGDPNPRVLSGAGLGCTNLRGAGGVAIILKDLTVSAECRDDAGGVVPCDDLQIESRIYDSSDPTGQTYSRSNIRRKISVFGKRDLIIPFSNFTNHSPRGRGRLECAGAVTITITLPESHAISMGLTSVMIDERNAPTRGEGRHVQSVPTSYPRERQAQVAVATALPRQPARGVAGAIGTLTPPVEKRADATPFSPAGPPSSTPVPTPPTTKEKPLDDEELVTYGSVTQSLGPVVD